MDAQEGVAAGAEVLDVLHGIHAEGDQAAAQPAPAGEGRAWSVRSSWAREEEEEEELPRGPTYPTRARPPQESQARAPGWYEIRVTIIWLQAGQQICMGCSRKMSGPGM